MVLEAMKMEHRIVATADGTVVAVHYEAGDRSLKVPCFSISSEVSFHPTTLVSGTDDDGSRLMT